MMKRSLATVIVPLLLASPVAAVKAQVGTPPPDALAFDVASVRPSTPDQPYHADNDLDGTAPWQGSGLDANASVHVYIVFAYDIRNAAQAMPVWNSLPAWAKFDKFQIQAKSSHPITRDEAQRMMRTLLADRFALRVHTVLKSADVFAVGLIHPAHTGPNLKLHPAAQPCSTDPDRPDDIATPAPGAAAPRYCGKLAWQTGSVRHVQILDASMSEIATFLSDESIHAGFPTAHAGTDATGLTGQYDLDLEYTPANLSDLGGTTFQAALQKQAGLKLVEKSMPISILVIDHVERPAPN